MRTLAVIGYVFATIVFGFFLLLSTAPWGGENYGPSASVRLTIFGVYAVFCIVGAIPLGHVQKTKLDIFLIWLPVVAALTFTFWFLIF